MIKGVGQGVGRDIGRSAGRNEGDGERSKDFLFAGLRNANASIDDNAEAVAGTSLTASLSRGDGRGDGRNDGDTDGSDDGRCDGARDGRDDGPRDGREDGAKVCANDAGGEGANAEDSIGGDSRAGNIGIACGAYGRIPGRLGSCFRKDGEEAEAAFAFSRAFCLANFPLVTCLSGAFLETKLSRACGSRACCLAAFAPPALLATNCSVSTFTTIAARSFAGILLPLPPRPFFCAFRRGAADASLRHSRVPRPDARHFRSAFCNALLPGF